MSTTYQLNNGLEMPIIGLGTYKSTGELKEAIKNAIDVGYRHIDCAWFYANEEEVGEGIAEKIKDGTVKREELFVVTKLWNNFHSRDKVVPMLKESLQQLNLSYIDLFLVHWPYGFKETAPLLPTGDEIESSFAETDYLETWEGMEDCVKLGLAKSIGLSNFNSQQIDRLLENCKIKPVVNQVEVNPNINQKKLIEFCKEREIIVVGFCPLGRSSYVGVRANFPTPTIHDPKVAEIGAKYNKSPAQVVLNYLVSLGISVIPKSVTKSRIIENFQVLDFELSQEEKDYLDLCNKNIRISPSDDYKNHKFYPFNIEF